MAERYVQDKYSFEEYSDDKIIVGGVCGWSFIDVAQRGRVISVEIPDAALSFSSGKAPWLSEEKVALLGLRLRQAEAGTQAQSVPHDLLPPEPSAPVS